MASRERPQRLTIRSIRKGNISVDGRWTAPWPPFVDFSAEVVCFVHLRRAGAGGVQAYAAGGGIMTERGFWLGLRRGVEGILCAWEVQAAHVALLMATWCQARTAI
jgi:hypothetical protein